MAVIIALPVSLTMVCELTVPSYHTRSLVLGSGARICTRSFGNSAGLVLSTVVDTPRLTLCGNTLTLDELCRYCPFNARLPDPEENTP